MHSFENTINMSPLDYMRSECADREEIRFTECPDGTTIVCYMISGDDTFSKPIAREARGIVFNKNGQVIGRPLHKFFNVDENPSTQFESMDWSKVTRVMLKRDGSMIHTVNTPSDNRTFSLKSKKSYASDVAKLASNYINQHVEYIDFCNWIVENDLTAIFEWTSPTSRIVIGYQNDELQLLHVRDNKTGKYKTQDELDSITHTFKIPVVQDWDINYDPKTSITNMYNQSKDETAYPNVEGWVIQFADGDMVKLKTKWYLDRHHAMTFLRHRDIAKMVLNESLDDLKSKLVGDNIDITPILDIERRVIETIAGIEHEVNKLFETTVGKDRKTVALENKTHRYFALLMEKYTRNEFDVKRYFERNLLESMFDLTQINLVDVAE